jgi:predicted DNA-binding transcriptional regulator YafY
MSKRDLQSAKLLRVMHLYLAVKATPDRPPRELQRELGIGTSAYDRYRSMLRGLGVEFRFDKKARRHVMEKDAFLTAPGLTLDERLALILAVSQLGEVQESFLASRARQAAAKLLAVNDAAIGAACSALLGRPELPARFGARESVVDGLFRAITERRRVRIAYRKPHANAQEFEVDPYQLYVQEGALYLDGFHWGRRAVRCFKVCRFQRVWPTGIVFTNMRGYDYDERRRTAFCVVATDREAETVRIGFSPFAAPYIREEYRHPTQQLTEHEGGSLTFEVTVSEPREVLWWAMRWGGDFEVLEPQWLRDEAVEKVRKMAGVYGMRVER